MSTTSTSTPCDLKFGAVSVASASVAEQDRFLAGLTRAELRALPTLFEFWALEHQLPPESDWRTWVVLGGRGAGKTRAGAEWVRSMVEGAWPLSPGKARRVALVGETIDQAREIMVFGESGLLACAPPDRRPDWIAGRRMLRWPNGAEAQIFSAHEPESLRGPQFDAVWADELAKWKKGQECWDMLQFALRLGDDPRSCVTTTPRNVAVLKDPLKRPSTVKTHAPTEANRAGLAAGFLEEIMGRFAGTRLGRQELEGILSEETEGALWQPMGFEASRISEIPELDRIVVAVDPTVTSGKNSDDCGIVVAGVQMRGKPHEWRAFVLADATVSAASPMQWARAAIAARDEFEADRLVAEVNQGGDLVEEIIRSVDPLVPYRGVRATRGKVLRAEPVAALYEQGRVVHLRGLGALEEQMCQMTAAGFAGEGSPDRVDALVYALHDLMIEPAASYRNPSVRGL